MPIWKKFLLIGAGVGTGLAIMGAAIIGGWIWYEGRPHPPKPWNSKAILATYDYPDVESGPADSTGFRPDQLVFYYTIENTTEFDYRMPPREQLQLAGKLEEENSITVDDRVVTLGDQPIFLPAKQRMRIGLHFGCQLKNDFGPKETADNRKKRRTAIAEYMENQANNLNGFVLFDTDMRYRIDFPPGWKQPDSK